MKLLVTGGTGFLGIHLVPKLLEAGHEVRLIGRTKPTLPSLARAEFIPGDIKDREAVRRALQGVEAVYHLAGLVSFRDRDARRMYELHVNATRELLKDVREAGVKRFILASTSGTIAVSKHERVGTEEDDYPITVVGRWPYYLSKIYEEKLTLEFCRKHAIPLVVLNPSLLMGPGDDRLSSTWTVVKFLNRELPAMPGGGISFVDVRDAAEGFFQALTRGEIHGRHLMGVNLSMTDFFDRLERLTGVAAPRLHLPAKVNVLGAHLLERWAKLRGTTAALDHQEVDIAEHYFYVDTTKAERELGFVARDPQQTLHDTVQYIYTKMPPKDLPGIKGLLAEKREGT
ncbi:NAD-dependent epimerase/dehydratase family protein [Stigmatella aurantiaca]|uniref:Dihydroflavonol 4-reductase, putative n=1 Tax=Stigmatella aurantiaca (strain DW4/3-1) TaxID=378806 RepID=Q09CU7_STIAD|nr:NAD-dependent epimerase/dehydratase family protein [Stigmatella aurantiaca]ADO70105.1 NAD dependent epimerase/dehydratase family protein [Stigmatella aurantiaca DW4/3-1]EAU69492.1 dihydroflavonol 4-reductase, putative [Stigmatella aurantiaca DW4/3-1]